MAKKKITTMRAARLAAKMSQAALAAATGIPVNSISRIERRTGGVCPGWPAYLQARRAVAQALGLDPAAVELAVAK